MIIEKNGLKYFTFGHLSGAGVAHCVTTRVGGVSGGVYESLNMGFGSGDDAALVQENYRRVCDALGIDGGRIARTRQVHGVNVQAAGDAAVYEDTDGLMTNKTGVSLVTYYADCVPLLFYDPKLRVVANAHAGWRGVADNMAGAVVAAMIKHYGCEPSGILVGIGPSICVDNFEVDKDVPDVFKKKLPFSDKFIYNSRSAKNKYHVDLWSVCRESLILAGVKAENIETSGICTYERADLFYSHRRDGVPRGNMAAFIVL